MMRDCAALDDEIGLGVGTDTRWSAGRTRRMIAIASNAGKAGGARSSALSTARYDFRADPVLRAALAYWEGKRGDRPMPQRGDIDPDELRPVLSHLQITEVIDGGSRFRYRLVGTAIVEAFGAEFTGRYVDELMSGERD